jgi:hypothetical protein
VKRWYEQPMRPFTGLKSWAETGSLCINSITLVAFYVSFLNFIEQSKIERIPPPFSKGGSIIFIYGVIEFKKGTILC